MVTGARRVCPPAADGLHIHEMLVAGRTATAARDKTFLARLGIRRRVALGRGVAAQRVAARRRRRSAVGGDASLRPGCALRPITQRLHIDNH